MDSLANGRWATKPNEKIQVRGTGYKRPFDLSILTLAHLLLLPLWIVLWTVIPLSIWLGDRGPIFYRQKRAGKDGRTFTILKFRTMDPDASTSGPTWTITGDPRVTRVGRILRRTALDELPEVLSIWTGDMSLVGPRALDQEEQKSLEDLIPGFAQRLQVLPGLTGLAQIYDRNDDAHDKFRYDSEYLNKVSLFLDLKLLFLSVFNTLTARWDQRSGKPIDQTTSTPAINGAKPLNVAHGAPLNEGSPERSGDVTTR